MSGGIDVADARTRLAAHVSERAYTHSIAVAEGAARLAQAYHLDADTAYLAGLLHDWARDDRAADLIRAATESGIDVTAVDEAVPYLLHAPVGARQVAEAFPDIAPAVVAAIEAHTLGDPGMGDLACVVYIADMIEPARRFEGVDELRDLVGHVTLDELFVRAYAASLIQIVSSRRRLHPRTAAVWNAIIDRRGA